MSSDKDELEAESGIGYADAIVELDHILTELDSSEIDIDVLSAKVERAAHLISVCRSRIVTAQNQVNRIVGSLAPEPQQIDAST